jgi:UDP-glucose 4-epimerase
MQKILILGANGFIGRPTTIKLKELGYDVMAFDIFSQGDEFFREKGIKTYKGSFLSRDDIDGALQDVDIVFHLITVTTPAVAEKDILLDINQNVVPTLTLMELAVSHGVKKIVFTSTGGAIYGMNSRPHTSEDTIPTPISPYAIGKLTIENYLNYYSQKYGIGCVVYRLSNPYGPGQVAKSGFGVIPTFIDCMRSGKPITVMGDGSMTRDYIYIDDMVEMITRSFSGAKHTLYNIGTGGGTTIRELIAELESVMGRTAIVEHVPHPKTYTQNITLNINRFESEFGTTSFTSLSEGLRRTIERV